MKNKDLKRRIIEISYRHKLSHLGSNLTAVDIIDEIYSHKKQDEPFVLSSGHAGLALYVILEKYEHKDADALYTKHGTHPNRDAKDGIYCSTGSLGQGLPIAVGMALADRTKQVYCLISDGEFAEGSIHESLRIMRQNKIDNLNVHMNFNGYSAYDPISDYTEADIRHYQPYITIHKTHNELPFLNGLQAHYHVMTPYEYGLSIL